MTPNEPPTVSRYYVILLDDNFELLVVGGPFPTYAKARRYAETSRAYAPEIVVSVAAQLEEHNGDA